MKKTVFPLLVAVLLLTALAFSGCSALALLHKDGDMLFRYLEEIDGYVLLSYSGMDEELVIPEEINGTPVLRIGALAFANGSTLKRITVPNSVVKIYKGAFAGCTNLEEITLPYIGETPNSYGSYDTRFDYIFKTAEAHHTQPCVPTTLQKVTVTQQTYYRMSAFYGCASVKTVVLPSETTELGESVFGSCSSLVNFQFPSRLTAIYGDAFRGTALRTVTLSQGIATVGGGAFSNMPYLESVILPEGVSAIGGRAFANNPSLYTVVLPRSIQTLGEGIFTGSTVIDSVYYMGSLADWQNVSVHAHDWDLVNSLVRFYSEEEPTDSTHGYWHYVNGVPVLW